MNRLLSLAVTAVIAAICAGASAEEAAVDRSHAGAWYVSDDTDNNTGERKVYAFVMHLEDRDPDYVTVTMGCDDSGKPGLVVEWDKLPFPDQAVLSIGATSDPDAEPEEKQFVFTKGTRGIGMFGRGLIASPETSAQIIALMAENDYATITAHVSPSAKTVGIEVGGTPQAWDRVVRHCPAPKMPLPPL